ncbi:unnamed protein product [Schistocephalus solidus]|uniref:Uncharacterized protein n=1 Tax=Schistocephalus solidus TaxID=70667 RepID=A0A183SYU4_SCHSO|nr:unnamed protein product [Schistocephalus solidus]
MERGLTVIGYPSPAPGSCRGLGVLSTSAATFLAEGMCSFGGEPHPDRKGIGTMSWTASVLTLKALTLTAGRPGTVCPRVPATNKSRSGCWSVSSNTTHPKKFRSFLHQHSTPGPPSTPSVS